MSSQEGPTPSYERLLCIYNYFQKEVLQHVPEAWINVEATKIGYEISFHKYFYRHQPLRNLEEITADKLALEKKVTS
ncbi:type I restriction enzyme M protein [Chitinophaga costaii]|uniref:Type I restriction enzyme M protein n=1 Tax=Chitinophaga costaii TaxID=1335309 RepID=A0A1C3YR83_9BACT|nr:hypothetical protein [Chitinophaga costaii]SCB72580.1 type I restriction enzyme M protein [Chitinophaga costaii]